MGRDDNRDDKRRDRRDRSWERRRERSRSRSRDRNTRNRGGEHRYSSSENSRRDYRRDDRRDRDRGNDRGNDRGERKRSRERRKLDSPEPPRGNKFFDRARRLGKPSSTLDSSEPTRGNKFFARARKLGIVPDTPLSTATPSPSSSDAEQPSSSYSTSATAASLAAARALALSASLTQAGANRGQTAALGAPLGEGVVPGAVSAASPNKDVPSYYNPANVNTQRIADQIKKRKMLWTRPGSEDGKEAQAAAPAEPEAQQNQPGSSTVKYWAKATFKGTPSGDDGKMTAKFRKLMGMRDDDVKEVPPPKDSSKVLDEQDQLFKQLDLQYQAARATTHTQRGMGLGWGH